MDPFGLSRGALNGDVMQRIVSSFFSPSMTVNYSGDTLVEQRVVAEVASFGKQLGWLNDIVLALATQQAPRAESVAQLQCAMRDIALIKEQSKQSALKRANDALDRLRLEQADDYRQLIRERAR